ncbi:Hypothetical predicted protein [Prunus dulcis]|uniref:Uncharacterized protein n=1 Tax=Prunus dulcis TaxID=3755 RepID=A0A5E4GGK8_PRUDU|nr:Hypothetical predicted protein [Prunus dulcis]
MWSAIADAWSLIASTASATRLDVLTIPMAPEVSRGNSRKPSNQAWPRSSSSPRLRRRASSIGSWSFESGSAAQRPASSMAWLVRPGDGWRPLSQGWQQH